MALQFICMVRLLKSLIASLTILLGLATFSPVFAQASSSAHVMAKEGKVQACQSHEASIKQRSDQLTKMAENMVEKFDAIAKRVEDYYTTKAVPAGKTVSNYNSLVSDITSKKTAVQTALATAQAGASAFSCTLDNPRAQLTQFRKDMQTVKTALKDYRTSIKNLIVAVRGVTNE